ncbi:hypothetical protein ABKV19_014592 [Rosa sericea]
MEEIREVALAYYYNCPAELQGKTWEFFQSMDKNGDRQISPSEFNEFLDQTGYNKIFNDPEIFAKLDCNGDRGLDFYEVLTFYYIIKTCYIYCGGCSIYLSGLYFTCFDCFEGANPSTFDLCDACYRNGKFTHHHTHFIENHILLYYKRGPDSNMAMENLHTEASEYFKNKATPEVRTTFDSLFQSMATVYTDGAKKISDTVFDDFLKQNGYNWIIQDPYLFYKLDRNQDRRLDFEEMFTFSYILRTRYFNCRECQVFLSGLYFTCVACFDGGAHYCHPYSDPGTYNLCAACYRSRNFIYQHRQHTHFLDNHILLRSKRGHRPYAAPHLVNYTVIKSHLVL